MAAKLLIAGLANSGKTTLLKDLQDTLVIAHDGKKFPFKVPHVNVDTFNSTAELIDLINSKVAAYEERFGEFPKTIAFDSVSKIFDTMNNYCNEKFTGFAVYSNLDKEIGTFTSYIENTLIANGINVVIVSHAIFDADTATYQLVGKASFQKRGGFLSEVDQAIFVETKANKRTAHLRSTKFPARTLREEDPDSMDVKDFTLQAYIEALITEQDAAADFVL